MRRLITWSAKQNTASRNHDNGRGRPRLAVFVFPSSPMLLQAVASNQSKTFAYICMVAQPNDLPCSRANRGAAPSRLTAKPSPPRQEACAHVHGAGKVRSIVLLSCWRRRRMIAFAPVKHPKTDRSLSLHTIIRSPSRQGTIELWHVFSLAQLHVM